MNNQARNHLNLQKHIADQDHIIRVRNAEIAALRKRAEKAEQERDQARRHEGVAAEQATEQARLAQEALRERDEALRTLKEVLDSHDETLRDIAEGKYAAENRSLTADAITDEMVERAKRRFEELDGALVYTKSTWVFRQLLTAALTEPPARPEGAYELETVIGCHAGKWTSGAEDVRALADLLASQGVRATEGN